MSTTEGADTRLFTARKSENTSADGDPIIACSTNIDVIIRGFQSRPVVSTKLASWNSSKGDSRSERSQHRTTLIWTTNLATRHYPELQNLEQRLPREPLG